MKEINYKYKFDDSYNPDYVNGAIGGINPQGEIIINFYLERNSLPKTHIFDYDETTGVARQSSVMPLDYENTFVRYISSGVVFNYKTAKEIHRWLGEHIKTLETDQNGSRN